MTSACCTAVLFAIVVCRISDSYVTKENGCNAAQVIEGGTGVVEFFLRKAINMSSDDVFANLRRGSDSDTDIVRCLRHSKTSPVYCTLVNMRYLTDGLTNNSITVSIPNVTREFEDTYTLRVYVNSKAEPLISCRLEVIALTAPTTPHGDAGGTIDDVVLIAVVAGSVGVVAVILVVIICVCCVRKVRRSKKKRKKDVTFYKEEKQAFTLLPVPANKKRSDKAADRLLPLNTPSKASEVVEQSSPSIEVIHTPEPDEFRRRKVGTSEVEKSEKAADGLLPLNNPSTASDVKGTSPRIETNHTPDQDAFRRRKGGTSEVESIHNNSYKSTTSQPVLEAKHNIEKQTDLTRQRWYFGNVTSEEATKCLLAAENGDGSFLVIDSDGKFEKYLLKMKCNGQVKSRMICASQSGFWIEKHKGFPTVTDLIDYYREHAGCFPTNLFLPCVRTSNIA